MYTRILFSLRSSLFATRKTKIKSIQQTASTYHTKWSSRRHTRRRRRRRKIDGMTGIERERELTRMLMTVYLVYVFWLMGVRMFVWVCERVWQKSVCVICMRANRCCDKVQRTFLSVSFHSYLIPVELLILCSYFFVCICSSAVVIPFCFRYSFPFHPFNLYKYIFFGLMITNSKSSIRWYSVSA